MVITRIELKVVMHIHVHVNKYETVITNDRFLIIEIQCETIMKK